MVTRSRSNLVSIALANIREERRKNAHFLTVLRRVLTGIAVVLGFVGFGGDVLPKNLLSWPEIAQAIQTWSDAFYKTLGLLTLRLPQQFERPGLPLSIQVARLMLPAMGLWLSINAYLRLAKRKFRFFRLFQYSDHVIVVGPGLRAHNIARQCRADESVTKVTYVTDTEDAAAMEDLHGLGVVVIHGNPGEPDTYIRAGLKLARAIVIAGDHGMECIRFCTVVRETALKQRPAGLAPLSLVVAIDSSEMTALMDASFREGRDSRIEYRLLDPLDNIARSVVKRLLPIMGAREEPRAIVQIGWSGPAPLIFRRILRNCPPKMQILLVDRAAEMTKASLAATSPGLPDSIDLRYITAEPNASILANADFTQALLTTQVGAFVVDGDSDEINFRIAIQLRRFARTNALWTPPIYIRQQTSDTTLDALKLLELEPIDVSRIYAFGSLDEQYAADAVLRDTDETMARAAHQSYLALNQTRKGPNMAPWEQLPETFRSANRAQAEHIDVKLARAKCRRIPASGAGDFKFTPAETEQLAELEHWRWCVDRWMDGWTYAPKRDDNQLKHDLLVPYDQLDESWKKYDREAIDNLPRLVELAKERIVRETRIPLDSQLGQVAGSAEAIAAASDRGKKEGDFPIVVLPLSTVDHLNLARDLQSRGLRVQLVLSSPITALPAALRCHELNVALDAADSVTLAR